MYTGSDGAIDMAAMRRDTTARWYTTFAPAPGAPLLTGVVGGIAVAALAGPGFGPGSWGGMGGREMPVMGVGPTGARAGGFAMSVAAGLTGGFSGGCWECGAIVGAGSLRGTTGGGGNGAFWLTTTACGFMADGTDGGGGIAEAVPTVAEGCMRLGTGGTGGAGGRRGELAASLGRTGGGTGDEVVTVVVEDIVVIAKEEGVCGGVAFGGTGRGTA